MTTLESCRTCGTPVSPTAKACPQCGERHPSPSALRNARIWVAVFVAFLILLNWYLFL